MKQRTRYLVTCWVGAYALAVTCYLNGKQMSALAAGVLVGAVGVMLFAARKMTDKKGGVK